MKVIITLIDTPEGGVATQYTCEPRDVAPEAAQKSQAVKFAHRVNQLLLAEMLKTGTN